MPRIAPFGTWSSPITLERLVEDVVGLSFPSEAGAYVYWVESRPAEGGRQVLVRAPAHRVEGAEDTGAPEELFGAEFSARTLAHEYGGLCYAVHVPDGDAGEAGRGPSVYFSNFSDQRIYRLTPDTADSTPVPITPEPPQPRSVRFAAPVLTADGRHIICVRETHRDPDAPSTVVNDLVVISTSGDDEPRVLAEGRDFYSNPVLSADGRRLAWTCWDHPNMPWDGTELWEADVDTDLDTDAGLHLSGSRLVAGGPTESVVQPKYTRDGTLIFCSDRTDWWNLYAVAPNGSSPVPLAPMEAEVGGPDWVFGMSAYAVLGDGTIVATWGEGGLGRLGALEPGSSTFQAMQTEWTDFSGLRASADGRSVLALAASATAAPAVVRVDMPGSGVSAGSGAGGLAEVQTKVYKRSRRSSVEPGYLSVPEPLEFATAHGRTAHALVYRPANRDFVGPEGERPPLIVSSHGGPTSAVSPDLNYGIQFWTSRGFAVIAVNYGGSTGYGREYRERLRGQWGVVDVEDCVHAAQALVESGDADADRLLIHGGSAGGYTTMCAVTWTDVFAAGASYFGIADATVFAGETHKFESHYTDSLFGPWPEAEAVYRERSAISHTDQLRTPLIIFQGLEDKIVPPNQAEIMVGALRDNGIPHAYVPYEGEQHGFRKAENVMRTSEAELYFYGRILGFEPADDLRPVEIVHEDRIG